MNTKIIGYDMYCTNKLFRFFESVTIIKILSKFMLSMFENNKIKKKKISEKKTKFNEKTNAIVCAPFSKNNTSILRFVWLSAKYFKI